MIQFAKNINKQEEGIMTRKNTIAFFAKQECIYQRAIKDVKQRAKLTPFQRRKLTPLGRLN